MTRPGTRSPAPSQATRRRRITSSAPPVALGNSGGLITLLNPDGLKVDGVAYTKAQAATEGRSLIF